MNLTTNSNSIEINSNHLQEIEKSYNTITKQQYHHICNEEIKKMLFHFKLLVYKQRHSDKCLFYQLDKIQSDALREVH